MKRTGLVFFQFCLICLGTWAFVSSYGRLRPDRRNRVFRRDVSSLDRSLPLMEQGGESNGVLRAAQAQDTYRQHTPVPTNETAIEATLPVVRAVLDREDTSSSCLQCPPLTTGRYDHLRLDIATYLESGQPIEYFFALNLHQNIDILPRLLGSIIDTVLFLGPQACAISVVEGRSTDGTYEVLYSLRESLEALGVRFYLRKNESNPVGNRRDRVEAMAELRNEALQPLLDQQMPFFTQNTTIIFLNDVAICSEDILELIHQRHHQGADMTCGMDWTYAGKEPTFNDVYTARDMRGELFYYIPRSFDSFKKELILFWENSFATKRFLAGLSMQVFSCWNGAAVFTAKPLLDRQIRFRGPHESECYENEPKLFCKDLWMQGYGKIALVPTVNLGYSDAAAEKIKKDKGYVSNWVENMKTTPEEFPSQIDWQPRAPELVKCMPEYYQQSWTLWDQGLSRFWFG